MSVAVAVEKRRPRRFSLGLNRFVLVLVMFYLFIPLMATFIFGLSSPQGAGAPFQSIFADSNFCDTLVRSLQLSLASTLLAIILVTPTAYWQHSSLASPAPRAQ